MAVSIPPSHAADLIRQLVMKLRLDDEIVSFCGGESRRVTAGIANEDIGVSGPTGIIVETISNSGVYRGAGMGEQATYVAQITPHATREHYNAADPLELYAVHDRVSELINAGIGPYQGRGMSGGVGALVVSDEAGARVILPGRWRFESFI